MKLTLRYTVFLVFVGVAVAAAIIYTAIRYREYRQSPSFYFKEQQRMVDRVLASDPHLLLSAGRQLLQSRPGYVGEISVSSSDVPQVIRRLKPTRIKFRPNSLWVGFSDVFNPFGIVVLPAGVDGPAPTRHKWIDGLWLFDDGQLHTNGVRSVTANGSQPIRPETNRTSSAPGSRR